MCNNKLSLYNIYNKSILWGQIDSKLMIDRINASINDEINYLEINLENIKSLDEFYISSVFIDTLKSTRLEGKELVYIFSNPSNDEIIFQLSNILLTNSFFSILKTDEDIEIIGNASYFKKILFKSINENREINPVLICEEFEKPFDTCKIDFEEFVNIGFLEKESDEVYRTNLSLTL